jgi:hypothetical protein
MAYTTINKPTDYFNTKLYTGDGTDGREITGVGFQPDWCWFKARSTAYENQVYDVVRGATKRLVTNDTTAEGTQTNGLQSFDSDGFTVGNGNGTNVNAVTYASWNWLAGGTASSNTDGSITSTVSANTTSGFSIVSYTGNGTAGATVGHGLGSIPQVVITKERNGTAWWGGYFASLGNTKSIYLNQTNSADTSVQFWNNTSPTSSVFTVGSNSISNRAVGGSTYIAYCFAEKKGFSKFGSYIGNGSTDGTFVYTGFKPSFVLQKKSSSTSDWVIYDNKRDPSNVVTQELKPNSSAAENSFTNIDILSNGFKQRADYAYTNNSGATYIYMAFAENPFVTSTGIPATAR